MYKDIRYALRTLRSAKAFGVTVVLTLGIGLGLNTTLFTLFNAYVLHPFAVKDPHALYEISWTTTRNEQSALSWEQFQEIRQSSIFSDAFAFSPLLARVESRNLQGMSVSGNYFTMLGVGAALGRPILEKDTSNPGAGAVVVLSQQLWKAAFAGDPGIIGRTIRISGRPFEVIGVGPKDFVGVAELPIDFFIPITTQREVAPGPDLFGPDKPRGVLVIGRLREAMPLDTAKAALTVWIKNETKTLDKSERAIQGNLTSRATPISFDSELLVIFIPLLVVFGLVMVTCCANVSNMMLARALGRQREIGVRLAIGAQRARLIRQMLTESVLLSLLAGLVGFAVSNAAIAGAQRLLAATLPPPVMSIIGLAIVPLDPDYRVFLFILAAAGVSTIVFGLAPALQATRTSLVEALRGEFGAGVSSSRLRSALVVSQISVCVILLVLAGILLRGSTAFQHTNVGYNTHGIVYPLFVGRNAEASELPKLAERLNADPWVKQWATAWHPPLFSLAQIPLTTAQGAQSIQVNYNLVSPEYFGILDIPILRGRNFSEAEAESEAAVAIVSQATAQKLWPNEDGLGKTITLDGTRPATAPRTDRAVIIGIAKTVSSGPLEKGGPDATMIYFPTSAHAKRVMTFLIRGEGDVSTATRHLEGVLEATIPNRPVISISLDQMFLTQAYPFLAAAWIAAMLGGLALLLALSGMYGVLTYLVGQRTKEIGIRVALGATPGMVMRLILNQSLKFAAWGVGLGIVLAFGGSLLLRHLITRINAYDGFTYTMGSLVVMLAALVAAFFPSSRAARINPVETLRAE